MSFNTTITGDPVWAQFESTKISTANSILVERLSRQIGRIVDDEEIEVGFKKKKIMVVMFLKVERWRD